MENSSIILTRDQRPETRDQRPETRDQRPETRDQPIVSFCIPVYNRAKVSEALVKGILSSSENCFEVVVSDNASSDNTQELLINIQDRRFKYYRFDKPVSVMENWKNALSRGQGEYLYLVMNRDKINGEGISRLAEILRYARDNNINCLIDRSKTPGTQDITVYEGNIDAMIYFLGPWHDSGNIFSRKIFHEGLTRTDYFSVADAYVENYFKRDCLLTGKGAYITSGAYSGESLLKDETRNKSTTPEVNGSIDDMAYSPKRRTKLFFEMIDMIDADIPGIFSTDDVNKFFRNKFSEILNSVSYAWSVLRMDYLLMSHYGHNTSRMSLKESFGNIIGTYHKTQSHLQEKGTYTRSKQFIMYSCFVKALIIFPLKLLGRKIFHPLGIWDKVKMLRKNLQR